MSGGTNNFRRNLRNWQSGEDNDTYTPDHNVPNRLRLMFPESRSFQVTPDVRAGAPPPSHSFEERRITWPIGLASFPGPTLPPVQILVLDNNMVREANPMPRQIIQDSFLGSTGQLNWQVPTAVEDSRLTHDEQKKALKKLRREIYNPPPKSITGRLTLYYRDNAKNVLKEMGKAREEDGKRCAICLDDFESRQEVMLTPCNHMFHEDCIMPWLKSQGQCPICRYAFCE